MEVGEDIPVGVSTAAGLGEEVDVHGSIGKGVGQHVLTCPTYQRIGSSAPLQRVDTAITKEMVAASVALEFIISSIADKAVKAVTPNDGGFRRRFDA